MIADFLLFLGTLSSLVGSVVAVLSTNWSLPVKATVLVFCILGTAIPCAVIARQRALRRVDGNFEWQWAGENLIGLVSIESKKDNESQARLTLKRFISSQDTNKGEFKMHTVMECQEGGLLVGDRRGFTLTLPSCRKTQKEGGASEAVCGFVRLSARLSPIEAYAGLVEYVYDDGRTARGDMVLVKHISGIKGY